MNTSRPPARAGEAGYSLVALVVAVTVMMVMMAAAVPTWRYIIKNDHEEELLFRGGEIADAIARYQKKNGNALPPSLDALVKGKFLRKAYKDPMSKDGKWRFIRQGEAVGGPPAPVNPGGGPTTTTTTTTRPSGPGGGDRSGTIGGTLGSISGVASSSTEKSLRVFNGRSKYSEWLFIPGQPRIIGRQSGMPTVGGPPPGTGGPSGRPTPAPAQPRER